MGSLERGVDDSETACCERVVVGRGSTMHRLILGLIDGFAVIGGRTLELSYGPGTQ